VFKKKILKFFRKKSSKKVSWKKLPISSGEKNTQSIDEKKISKFI
jgi:hypothetical protein